MKSALIIFIKNPVKGKVKTRLAQEIGETRALEIYHHLLEHTHRVTRQVEADKFVFYGDFIEENDQWSADEFSKHLQKGNDLGERMQNAFDEIFQREYDLVAIIGSDNLEITPQIIEGGFERLRTYDVCIGPARDGGYYLLGLKKNPGDIFSNRLWSHDGVFDQAVKTFQKLNLTYFVLPALGDIDTADDLKGVNFMRYKKHVFICTNQREPGGKPCCGEARGMELVQLFKKSLRDKGLDKTMRAQKTGCLDACDFGPSLVVYPEGIFYGGVKPEDVEQIVNDHLMNDKPVERLITDFTKEKTEGD